MSSVRYCTQAKSPVTYDTPNYSDSITDNLRSVPEKLQDCRQLRKEAWKIYYSTNTFLTRPQHGKAYNHPALAADWLSVQQPGAVALIETVLELSCEKCDILDNCSLTVLVNLKTGQLKRLRCPQDKSCCDKESRTRVRGEQVWSGLETEGKESFNGATSCTL